VKDLNSHQQRIISVYLVGYFDADCLADALHFFHVELGLLDDFPVIQQVVINSLIAYEDRTGLQATEKTLLMLLRLLVHTGKIEQSINMLSEFIRPHPASSELKTGFFADEQAKL